MIASALLAVVVGGPAEDTKARSWPTSRINLAALALAFTIAMIGSLHRDYEQLTAKVQALGVSSAGAAAARDGMRLHPAEAYFPMIMGAEAGPTPAGGALLAHAVRLAPARAAPHYWLARWLWGVGRKPQALAEYRTAARLQPELWPFVAGELLRARVAVSELSALATTADHVEWLVQRLLAEQRTADAATLDERLIAEFPTAGGAYRREIARARAVGNAAHARAIAERWIASAPSTPGGYVELAAELPPAEAERMLNDALVKLGDDPDLVGAWMRVRAPGTDEPVQSDVDRLRAALLARGKPVYMAEGVLGAIAASKGRKAAALRHFRAAAAASPDGLGYLEDAAITAQDLGDWVGAAESWAKLAAAVPGEPRYSVNAQRARSMAAAAPTTGPPP